MTMVERVEGREGGCWLMGSLVVQVMSYGIPMVNWTE